VLGQIGAQVSGMPLGQGAVEHGAAQILSAKEPPAPAGSNFVLTQSAESAYFQVVQNINTYQYKIDKVDRSPVSVDALSLIKGGLSCP
jgi:hypothetical protein